MRGRLFGEGFEGAEGVEGAGGDAAGLDLLAAVAGAEEAVGADGDEGIGLFHADVSSFMTRSMRSATWMKSEAR